MEFNKRAHLREVLVAVSAMNAQYDALKTLETTSCDLLKKTDPTVAELLREHDETAYKIRQRIIQQITSMPEFREGAVN